MFVLLSNRFSFKERTEIICINQYSRFIDNILIEANINSVFVYADAFIMQIKVSDIFTIEKCVSKE